MKLRQILPRNFLDVAVIICISACLASTIFLTDLDYIAPVIVCGILTLIPCGGYGMILHETLQLEKYQQQCELCESERREREEMLK